MNIYRLQNPLVGHNDERFGPRFPAVNRTYTKELRQLFRQVADDKNISIKEGVYTSLGGPCYETVAELKALHMLGTDAIGMSTAHEALVANYCGMKVLAIALITNVSIMDDESDEIPNHEEVLETANIRANDLQALIMEFVKRQA